MPIIGKNVQNLKITHKNNKIFMFSDLFGKYVVLYFYPRDDTPGCTNEAKDFTELKPEFDKLNTIDKNKSSYEYLSSFNMWIKNMVNVNSKLSTFMYSYIFAAVALGFWFIDIDGKILGDPEGTPLEFN